MSDSTVVCSGATDPTAAPSVHQNSPEFTVSPDRLNCDPSNLNQKQVAAIELIASGRSYTTTAELLGIDRSTLYLWRQQPRFQERLEARTHELWGKANDRLKSMVEPALEVVARQLEAKYERTCWRAANLVLRLTKLGKIPE
jgi:hypothetical protein